MLGDPERDLVELGLRVRRKDHGANGPEARLDCPFCPAPPEDAKRRDPVFAVNLTHGTWHCFRCGERGNMFQLRQRLRGVPGVVHAAKAWRPPAAKGTAQASPETATAPREFPLAQVEAMHAALFAEAGASGLAYLRARGFTDETIRRFRLGYAARSRGNAIAIPYLLGGKCWGVKHRVMPPDDATRKYDREAGYTHPLFNQDAIDGEYRAAIVTEGELDAIALTQLDLGYPVISVPDGATASLKDAHREAIHHFDEFLLAFDQDEKGEEGAAKFAREMGETRCRRVCLPAKDANECLVNGVSREEIAAAVEAARPYAGTRVKHVSAWKDAILRPSEGAKGFATGWTRFDSLFGGVRAGEVTLLTAETGQGKSTFTTELARRIAVLGHPVFVLSLELGPLKIVQKLVSAIGRQIWTEQAPDRTQWAFETLEKLPVYLGDYYGDMPIPKIRDELTYAVRRHGVKFAVIDHLHFALGLGRPGDDERLRIDSAAHDVQSMALELGVHIALVMHPGKIKADHTGKTRLPEIGDLKGSSGPAQYADNIVRIARIQDEPKTTLTVLKMRSELGRLGSVVFAFDPGSLQFVELDMAVAGERKPARRDFRKAAAGDRE